VTIVLNPSDNTACGREYFVLLCLRYARNETHTHSAFTAPALFTLGLGPQICLALAVIPRTRDATASSPALPAVPSAWRTKCVV